MRILDYNLSVRINPGQSPNLSASAVIQVQNGSLPCSDFALYLNPGLEVRNFSASNAVLDCEKTPHPMGFAGRELRVCFEPALEPRETAELVMDWEGTIRGIIWGYCMIAPHLVELRDFACWYPLQGGDVQDFSWEMKLDIPAQGYPMPYTTVCNGTMQNNNEQDGRLLQEWGNTNTTDINIISSCWFQQMSKTSSGRTITIYYAFLARQQADLLLDQMHSALEFYTKEIGNNPKTASLNAVFTPRYAEGGYVYGPLTVMSEPQYQHYINFPELRPSVSLYGNGHELCHYWWREQVSVDRSTWHDWLMEALTEYWASMLDEHMEPGRAMVIYRFYRSRLTRLTDLIPVNRTEFDSPNRYVIWYLKGCWIIRMLDITLGTAAFRRAVRLFYDRFKGRRAETQDFISCCEEASRRDLAPFFQQWLERPDLPALAIEWRQVERKVEITVTQHTPPFKLDVEVLISSSGQGEVRQVIIDKAEQTYVFSVSGQVTAVELDPGEKTLFRRMG